MSDHEARLRLLSKTLLMDGNAESCAWALTEFDRFRQLNAQYQADYHNIQEYAGKLEQRLLDVECERDQIRAAEAIHEADRAALREERDSLQAQLAGMDNFLKAAQKKHEQQMESMRYCETTVRHERDQLSADIATMTERMGRMSHHPEMYWTKMTPKVDGWYWWRHSAGDGEYIVRVDDGYCLDDGCRIQLHHRGGEWCPILPPPGDVAKVVGPTGHETDRLASQDERDSLKQQLEDRIKAVEWFRERVKQQEEFIATMTERMGKMSHHLGLLAGKQPDRFWTKGKTNGDGFYWFRPYASCNPWIVRVKDGWVNDECMINELEGELCGPILPPLGDAVEPIPGDVAKVVGPTGMVDVAIGCVEAKP